MIFYAFWVCGYFSFPVVCCSLSCVHTGDVILILWYTACGILMFQYIADYLRATLGSPMVVEGASVLFLVLCIFVLYILVMCFWSFSILRMRYWYCDIFLIIKILLWDFHLLMGVLVFFFCYCVLHYFQLCIFNEALSFLGILVVWSCCCDMLLFIVCSWFTILYKAILQTN